MACGPPPFVGKLSYQLEFKPGMAYDATSHKSTPLTRFIAAEPVPVCSVLTEIARAAHNHNVSLDRRLS